MKVIASVAISEDGYMDDASSERLVLSCAEDWAEVYALRASCDAILVGAQTVRSDNPSLLIKDRELMAQRVSRGQSADITKVVISRSGNLDSESRFFKFGDCRKIVFVSSQADPVAVEALKDVADVVTLREITTHGVVDSLKEFGIERLMVEGGARTLAMFFAENMIDNFRLAVAPIRVDDREAVRLCDADRYLSDADTLLKRSEMSELGNMKVAWFERADLHYMKMAIEQSRYCVPTQTSYCVGAVVVTRSGELFCGYTHETSDTNHAEEEAIAKAVAADVDLTGSTIYSSIEPCSTRKSKPKSCSALIIEHGFSRAVFALYEPDRFVDCIGAQILTDAGVKVDTFDELADEVRQINSHIIG